MKKEMEADLKKKNEEQKKKEEVAKTEIKKE
jgi:hypothetical protein